jgi:hypothetical protein
MDIPSLAENSAGTIPRHYGAALCRGVKPPWDFSLVGIHEVAAIMPKKWYFSSRSSAQRLRVELSEFVKQTPTGYPRS